MELETQNRKKSEEKSPNKQKTPKPNKKKNQKQTTHNFPEFIKT